MAIEGKNIKGYSIQGLSLRKNISWNLFGNIVYALCQWGIIMMLAKLTNPEMVGRFAIGLSITAPIIILSQLQLRGVQATDVRQEYFFGHYLALRLVTTLLAMIVIVVIIYIVEFDEETGLVILAVGFSKVFESLSDIYYGLMQRHERMDRIAKSMMIKGTVSLCVMCTMVYITRNVLWGVIAMAVTWALVLVLFDMRSAATIIKAISPKNLMPIFEWKPLLRLMRLALPLGVVMCLISLYPNIPRYFIEHYWGERDLGIYAALAYLIVAGNMVVGAMGQSVTPRLANYYAAGEFLQFRKLLFRLVCIGIAMGAVGVCIAILGGRELLMLLYGSEYAVHKNVFIWLMIAGGLAYASSFLGYGMIAARHFRIQIPLFVLVTGAGTISARFLIPDHGTLGAAYALAIGSSIQLIGSAMVVLHALQAVETMKRVSIEKYLN